MHVKTNMKEENTLSSIVHPYIPLQLKQLKTISHKLKRWQSAEITILLKLPKKNQVESISYFTKELFFSEKGR